MTLTDLESVYLRVSLEELTLSWLAEYSMPQAEHAGLVGEVGKVRASSRGHCDLDFLALSQGARGWVSTLTFTPFFVVERPLACCSISLPKPSRWGRPRRAGEHRKEADAQAPHVSKKAIVPDAAEHLGRRVRFAAAHLAAP